MPSKKPKVALFDSKMQKYYFFFYLVEKKIISFSDT